MPCAMTGNINMPDMKPGFPEAGISQQHGYDRTGDQYYTTSFFAVKKIFEEFAGFHVINFK